MQGLLKPNTTPVPIKSKLGKLLRELSDDEDDNHAGSGSVTTEDPERPWLRDFRIYLDTVEHIPDGWSTITWWGVSC